MREFLFVYGTLQKPDVQKKVIGRTVAGEKEILQGWKKTRVMIGNEVYPVIVEDKNSFVEGVVLSLDFDELDKIDDYETSALNRKKITLTSGKNVWVYSK